MRVIVASKNPVKIKAVENAFSKVFDSPIAVSGLAVKVDVPDQPMSDEATLHGAKLRASAARLDDDAADFWVGIEGGVDFRKEEAEAFGWVVILSKNKEGRARSATFSLPPVAAQLLKNGKELGDINDQLFHTHNSKQQGGAVGLLTKEIVNRDELYEQAVVLALIPFLNQNFYLGD